MEKQLSGVEVFELETDDPYLNTFHLENLR